jgi:hypothetical protein
MQRHFSNRGEALPEVTAARMLVGRGRFAQSARTAQGGRQAKSEQWFTKPTATTKQPKARQPKHDENVTPPL